MYAKPVVEVVNFADTEIVVNLNASGGTEQAHQLEIVDSE